MKQTIVILFTIIAAVTAVISCSEKKVQSQQQVVSKDTLIKRGFYLVTIAGCGDCHSPKKMTAMGPEPDTSKLLSGHRAGAVLPSININEIKKGWALFNDESTAMVSPLGVSFAANITSDTTGIGLWSFQQFKTAMTKGKWKGIEGSRDLLPPMPWMNYKEMSDEDLQAIFAFLKSTKPVKNVVPTPQPIKL